ncbi:deazaflavin-dependent oxidoreductase (nitroreductase family) [Prauserella shujinwangii]|uniref:Deazaflavin-dependent oxidoreductase (Nitroreductase family) n=1 Tax=Prauserella shujinwangii TaxID=1453103 RepID=A0A2T0LPE6_9PSEU|nr:nitroreductase/quinone reductase family protein [Prauserella shujinwangii]PRX45122.1 deazaflavin-dependent oxidoreductase (nitroreductase family) [Prauserella shujinwangii]
MRNPLPALARALGTRPWLMRLAPVVVWVDARLFTLSRGRVSLVGIAGLPSLRLRTVGRRTGLLREHNLLYLPGDGDYVLTASNWGRRREPGWAHNLRSHPDAVVLVRGRAVAVRAHEAKGDEYDRLWAELVRFWPGYAMERAEAGRDLAVFVLRPAGAEV